MELKIHKTVSIDKDIVEDIRIRHLNFSEWVEHTYREQFLSEKSKIDEIEEHKKNIEKLEKEIKQIKERKIQYEKELTEIEKRYIKDIPRLLKEGKDLKALHIRFNITFKRDYALDKFKQLMRDINN